MPDKKFTVSQIPGLQQAADAARYTYYRQPIMDSETWNVIGYDDVYGEDPQASQRIIDQAMQNPTKWVANNLNWSGLGDRGDFSALDNQIKFLKDNNYDTSTLPKGALTQYNLTKQIIGQGTTGRWTGEGFGNPIENAKHMASTLMTAGIEDIKDFGKVKKTYSVELGVAPEYRFDSDGPVPTGRYYFADDADGSIQFFDAKDVTFRDAYDPEYGMQKAAWATVQLPMQEFYGNKKTQQPITQDYNGAYGNYFSGTYAGHGRTNFGVQFAADGTPYFYTQFGGDTSSMADIAPIITILAIIPSPLQPFAAAANAIIAIDQGNTLGALASLAGIPGVSEAVGAAGLAGVAEGIKTANQVVNLVNAVESGNVAGIVSSAVGMSGAGSTVIGDTGLTVSDAMKAANLVSAIASDDPAAIFKAATSFANSPTIKDSLNSESTTINADGQKVADVVDKNFVADLVNPDSSNYIGHAEDTLGNVVSSAQENIPKVEAEPANVAQPETPQTSATVTGGLPVDTPTSLAQPDAQTEAPVAGGLPVSTNTDQADTAQTSTPFANIHLPDFSKMNSLFGDTSSNSDLLQQAGPSSVDPTFMGPVNTSIDQADIAQTDATGGLPVNTSAAQADTAQTDAAVTGGLPVENNVTVAQPEVAQTSATTGALPTEVDNTVVDTAPTGGLPVDIAQAVNTDTPAVISDADITTPSSIAPDLENVANIINNAGAGTQVASTDNTAALEAIDASRNQPAVVEQAATNVPEQTNQDVQNVAKEDTSALDVLGQPLTEEAVNATTQENNVTPESTQQAETSPLDVLGQPLTEEAVDVTPRGETTESANTQPTTDTTILDVPSLTEEAVDTTTQDNTQEVDAKDQPKTSPLDVLSQPLTEEAVDATPKQNIEEPAPSALSGLSSETVGQDEQDAIDKAENAGDPEGLSSAEVGQGEQDAIDTDANIGNLEGLSSAEVGQGEQDAIDTISQDDALTDLTAAEEANPTTEPDKVTDPKLTNISANPVTTTSTSSTPVVRTNTSQTSSAPAGGLASVGIPWLDTSADVLEGQNVQKENDPLAGLEPELVEILRQRGLLPKNMQTTLMASGGSTFGSELDDKLMPKFAPSEPDMLQTKESPKRTPLTMKPLKNLQQVISPLGGMGGLAAGGLPKKYQEAAPDGHNTEFVTGLTGYYADGRGTGQSDDIPAMLHDGDYVMDAETVSALGDGSSKAGRQVLDGFRTQVPHSAKSGGSVVPAKIADGEYVFPESFVTALGQGDNKRGASILDGLREKLREHKRSAPLNKIPPKAKSPLDYIKKAKG